MQATKPASPVHKRDPLEQVVEKARSTIDLVSKYLLYKEFFYFWAQFARRRVIYDPETAGIAYTDDFEIAIGRKFIELGFEEQVYTILHELSHCILRHGLQQAVCLKRLGKSTYDRNIVKIVHNLVSDAIVDGLLVKTFEAKGIKNRFAETRKVIPEKVNSVVNDDVVKLGMINAIERIVYKVKTGEIVIKAYGKNGVELDLKSVDIDTLMKTHEAILVVIENKKTGGRIELFLTLDVKAGPEGGYGTSEDEKDDGEGGEEEEEGEGSASDADTGEKCKGCERKGRRIVIKEPVGGEPPKNYKDLEKIDSEARDFEREREMLKKKTAGAGCSVWEIYDLENLKERVPPWRSILRRELLDYINSFKNFTWRLVHPVAPNIYPGYYKLDSPDIIIMLDVSGSMLGGDLEKALGDIIGLAESEPTSKITLYTWSSTCSLPQTVDRAFVYNVRTRKKIAINTGGTEIIPALKRVLEDIKPPRRPFVIIMTDGVIYDIETEEAQRLLEKLVKKSHRVMFISTEAIPTLPKQIITVRI